MTLQQYSLLSRRALVSGHGPQQADGRQTIYAFGTDITARQEDDAYCLSCHTPQHTAYYERGGFSTRNSHYLYRPLSPVRWPRFDHLAPAEAEASTSSSVQPARIELSRSSHERKSCSTSSSAPRIAVISRCA